MLRALAVGVAIVATLSFFGVVGVAGVELWPLMAASGGAAMKWVAAADRVVVKVKKPKKKVVVAKERKGVRHGVGK